MKRRSARILLAAGALTALPVAAACAPPRAVSALVQRTACNEHATPPQGDACVHWVNHNPAWNYPANTEWYGPYYDFTFDVSHGNGAELLP
jgi:hypothetical protein